METKALDPGDIYLFEEQASTLPVWWSRRDKPRTVVYLDARLDLKQIRPQAIETLQACSKIDEVNTLEAPHHFQTSSDHTFGSANFLYAAHKLDLIERLIWVVPPHVPRIYSQAWIDSMLQVEGIGFDELTGFESIGPNVMRGRLLGLEVTTCDYDRLGSLNLDDDYYLDIDISYFVRVPEDRLWIEPAMVISKIVDQLGEPALVTISYGVDSGFTPLAFRFVGDYIFSRFRRQTEHFRYYWRLSSAIKKLSRGKTENGRKICVELTEFIPENAAAWYLLALISKDGTEKKRLLEEAASRDGKYGTDLARDSIGLLHRHKPLKPDKLQKLLQALESKQLSRNDRTHAEIALAKTLAAAGQLSDAERLIARHDGGAADVDDVVLAIAASRLNQADLYQQNRDLLLQVCEAEQNSSPANLSLGDLEYGQGNHQAALDYYRRAHERAPAWTLPLQSMLKAYQQLLMQREYDQVKQQLQQREQRLRQLLE